METQEELTKSPHDGSDALETVLSHVGDMGRYQKFLFAAMFPFGFFFAFVYFVQMFVAATPRSYWCRVPELEHLDLELRRNLTTPVTEGGWEQCLMYNANWTHVLETLVPPEAPTVPCTNGWEFELVDVPYHTVVSERGWVCEYSKNAPVAQAIFFAGSLVGGLVFGWLADRHGRVPALVGTNLVGCLGGIASIFTIGFWDFAISRFFVGMAYDSCFMMMYILVLEYVGPRHRTWVANMSIALYFGGGCLVLPWLALWISNWRTLLLVTSAPMLIVLAAPWVVPESARWLLSRGRVNDAVEVLKKFEKVNGTKIPQDVMDDFIMTSRQTIKTDESILTLFSSGPLCTMMVLMVIVYMACALIFDGLVRMSENLGLDFFITFTLTSATEIPSVTLLALVLDRWGRRKLTCGPMIVSGILSLIAATVPKGIPQVSLAIMARFCINMAYNAAIQWATELLPTRVRASGSSLVHVSGYVATVLSPFIVASESLWSPLPLMIIGSTGVVAGAVGVLLPETRGRPMPQTIADGERLVREYSLWSKTKRNVSEVQEKEELEKEKALIT